MSAFMLILALIMFIVAIGIFVFGEYEKVHFQSRGDAKTEVVSYRLWGFLPLCLGFLFMFIGCIRTVSPGQVAIPVAFGKAGEVQGEGMHFIAPWKAPWTTYHKVSVRKDSYTMSATSNGGDKNGDDSVHAQTADQLNVAIDSTVITRVDPTKARNLWITVGSDYKEEIVRPAIRSALYDEAAKYDGVDLGTKSREDFNAGAKKRIEATLGDYGIIVESVQIRSISLPKAVKAEVEKKAAAQQASEAQRFNLEKARQQAEIARTEAQATADSQQILACGAHLETRDGKSVVVPNYGDKCDQSQLTQQFLVYSYIQALQAIAQSENNSTVVVPSDSNLLPTLPLR